MLKPTIADGSVRDGEAEGFSALSSKSSGFGEEHVELAVLILPGSQAFTISWDFIVVGVIGNAGMDRFAYPKGRCLPMFIWTRSLTSFEG